MPLVELGILIEAHDKASGDIKKISESMSKDWKGALLGVTTISIGAGLAAAGLAKGLFDVAKLGADSAREIRDLGAASGLTWNEIQQLNNEADRFDAALNRMKGSMGLVTIEFTESVTPAIEEFAAKLKDVAEHPEDAVQRFKDAWVMTADEFENKWRSIAKAREIAKKSDEQHDKALEQMQANQVAADKETERLAKEKAARDAAYAAQQKQFRDNELMMIVRNNQEALRATDELFAARQAAAERDELVRRQTIQNDINEKIALNEQRFQLELAAYEQRQALMEQEKQATRDTARAIGLEFYATFQSIVEGTQRADEALKGLGISLAEQLASKIFGVALDALLGFAFGGPVGAVAGAVGGATLGGSWLGSSGAPRFVGRSGTGSSSSGLTGRGGPTVILQSFVPQSRGQIDRNVRDSVGPSLKRFERDS